jgi:hypothetical protein
MSGLSNIAHSKTGAVGILGLQAGEDVKSLVWTSSTAARRGALALALPASVLLYILALHDYLSGLDRPIFMQAAFAASLVVSCFHEFRQGVRWDYALSACLVNGLVFLCAAAAAPWIRQEYVSGLESLMALPEVISYVGEDMHSAVSSRLVGYGGCFGVALLVARMNIGTGRVRALVLSTFIAPADRISSCPHCGQQLVSQVDILTRM